MLNLPLLVEQCIQAPDLYLGYGQTKDAPPMYSFEYPANWEEQVVTKTDKSTMVSNDRHLGPQPPGPGIGAS